MASTSEEQQVPKKKKIWFWIFVLLTLILLSTCAYLYFFFGGKNSDSQNKEMKSVTLPSFTVNLADTNNRYLRTTITLEFSSDEVEDEINLSIYKVKDSILKVLRNTKASNLKNPEETQVLKDEILKEVNSQLTTGQVTGLYFGEFIVQ